jgi:hypothetical protein
MTIEREKCKNWLKKTRHFFCCESPMWVFEDNGDGTIKALCEYCGHEASIPWAELNDDAPETAP